VPVKRQAVPVFTDYKTYKRYLRIDFAYRCAYCGITERRWGSDRNFVVEHFRPQSLFPELRAAYANLYYACNRCNDIKSDCWPSNEDLARGESWIDPCESDYIPDHLDEQADGLLYPKTRAGRYTVDNLELNLRTYLVEMRLERKRLMEEITQTRALVTEIEHSSSAPKLKQGLQNHLELCERLLKLY
jgi:hypothetical protein